MQLPRDLAQMNAQELRDLAAALFTQVTEKDQELKYKQLKIDQLTHEMAILKRWRFGRRSEKLDPAQRSLLEETIDEDLEAIGLELEALRGKPKREQPKDHPRRTALPAHLPRREILTNPSTESAAAAVSSSASARTSARGSITSLEPSRSSATCAANGYAAAARPSSRRPCRRR